MIEAVSGASFVSALGTARQTSNIGQPTAAGTADFDSVLQGIASQAIGALREGEAAAAAGITGQVPVAQVVDKVLAAERTLQTVVALRDKMVGAYLEITRMQI